MSLEAGVVQFLHWLGYGLDNWTIVGLLYGQVIFLFSSVQSKSWAHTAPYSLSTWPNLSWSIKCLRPEADHSPPPSGDVKNEWNYTTSPTYSFFIFYFFYILYFVNSAPCYKFLEITNLTHFFHVFIYFMSLHVSSVTALIIRRSNCINTSSSPSGRTMALGSTQPLTEMSTRCISWR